MKTLLVSCRIALAVAGSALFPVTAVAGTESIRTFPGSLPKEAVDGAFMDFHADLSSEKFLVHVPPNYDGSEPFGLIVFIPGPGAQTMLPEGWDIVLRDRKLLFASPLSAVNKCPLPERLGLGVITAGKMEELYKIDPRRVYAAGLSGGARAASALAFHRPDIFHGTIQSVGSDFPVPVPRVHALPLERDHGAAYGILEGTPKDVSAARSGVRFVIITGPGDFRRNNLLDIYEGGFRKDGYKALLLDIPTMGHRTCGPDELKRALDFIETGK